MTKVLIVYMWMDENRKSIYEFDENFSGKILSNQGVFKLIDEEFTSVLLCMAK